MNVLLCGGSGMLGEALQTHMRALGWQVSSLRRGIEASDVYRWQPDRGVLDVPHIAEFDALVNLCGDNVGQGRWNHAKKQRILSSRIDSARTIAHYLAAQQHGPRILLNASGIAYYGDTGSHIVDEQAPRGTGFMADVASAWEQALAPARTADIRCVNLRLGMVLDAQQGALARMLGPFRLGLGGRIGNGEQLLSWITLSDACRAIAFLIANDTAKGPYNLVSPDVVSNAYFSSCLASSVGRKALLPMPAAMARLLFGEMADELLLASCGAKPARLQAAGFEFEQVLLKQAMQQLLAID